MERFDYRCIVSASLSRKNDEESYSDYFSRIKKDFLNNVFKNKYNFKNKRIKFDKSKKNGEDVECFYHTITARNEVGDAVREIDLNRYQKCLLVFTILDICSCDHIKCTQITIKPDPSNDNRISIYCNRFQYVIILEEKSEYYMYITAFPVSDVNVEKYS